MRFRDMREILKKNIQRLALVVSDASGGVAVGNIDATVTALIELKEIDAFRKDILFLEDIKSIFNSKLEPTVVPKDEWNKFNNRLEVVKLKGVAIIDAIDQTIIQCDDTSISIKLPPLKTLTEMKSYLGSFETALNQAVTNEQIKGKVEVCNVEAGSIWVDISLGSTLAVSLVAYLAWAGAVIRKKYYEGNIFREMAEKQAINAGAMRAFEEGMEKLINITCEAEAKNILSEFNIPLDNNNSESLERAKYTIKTFAELIQKGAEIHPSLAAPEDVKNLFPDFTKLGLIESKVKELPLGNSAKGEGE